MGGFLLQAPYFTLFPLDAKQLHYLVINDYIVYPSIGKADIEDRNKLDGLSRYH